MYVVCSLIIVHACPVHAHSRCMYYEHRTCTYYDCSRMISVHACTMVMVHACTMMIGDTFGVIKEEASLGGEAPS